MVVEMVVVGEEMVEGKGDEGEGERREEEEGRGVVVTILEEGEQGGRQKQELRYALDRMQIPYTSLHS